MSLPLAPAHATPLTGRIPELDGLRGLAAIGVVTAHYFGEAPHGWRVFTVGWLCVDVFFVLSGFLIGAIILEYRNRPGFFTTFYVRRAARILPAYFAALLLVFLTVALIGPGPKWMDPLFPLTTYLTITQNFAMVFGGDPGSPWLLPTWTLAVEEQFYIVAPIVLYLLPRRHVLPFLLAGIVAATAFRTALIVSEAGWLASLVLLPSRLDLFLFGVLGAWLMREGALEGRINNLTLRLIPLVALLILLPVMLVDASAGSKWFKVVGPLLAGLGTASFILAIVRGAPEGRRFRSRFFVFFGTISYGLYLIHQPVSGLLHGLILGSRPEIGSLAGLAVSFGAFGLSIAIGWISWRLMEEPILNCARRMRYAKAPTESRALQPA